MSNPRQPASGRIEAFDSLRGIAALGVVFWHYGAHFGAYPLSGAFSPFYHAGYLLVDFFFVLSGYVIARSYWKTTRRQLVFTNIRSRVARLYPLHFLTLIAVALMQWILVLQGQAPFASSDNDAYHFLLNLLMLNGVGFQQGFSFNGPAWSISTEFVVNCAFMIFIGSTLVARTVYLVAGTLLAAVLFSLSHVLLRDNLVLGYLDPQLVRCMLGFSLGAALQLAHRRQWLLGTNILPWIKDILAAAIIVTIVFFLESKGPHANVSSYFIIMALSAALLSTVIQANVVKRLLQLKPLVFLGDISYSIYLVHFPLQVAFVLLGSLAGISVAYGNPIVAATYFSAVIAASYLTYLSVELPCQAFLKSRLRKESVRAASPSL